VRGAPPLLDGALHDKVTEPSPAAAMTAVGADATVAGVTGAEGLEGARTGVVGADPAEADWGALGCRGGGLVFGVTAAPTWVGVAGGEEGSPAFELASELGGVVVGGKVTMAPLGVDPVPLTVDALAALWSTGR
jgi:hypothetical protein